MQLTAAAIAAAPNESREAARARGDPAAAQNVCHPSLMLLTNTAVSGIRTISESHRIVMPSERPKPGSGELRVLARPGITIAVTRQCFAAAKTWSNVPPSAKWFFCACAQPPKFLSTVNIGTLGNCPLYFAATAGLRGRK